MTSQEDEAITRKDFANLLSILLPQQTRNDEQSDNSLRLQRLSRLLHRLGPRSLNELDCWLDMQERGKPGSLLLVRSGEESDKYIVSPDVSFMHVNQLNAEIMMAVGLANKPLKRRKK